MVVSVLWLCYLMQLVSSTKTNKNPVVWKITTVCLYLGFWLRGEIHTPSYHACKLDVVGNKSVQLLYGFYAHYWTVWQVDNQQWIRIIFQPSIAQNHLSEDLVFIMHTILTLTLQARCISGHILINTHTTPISTPISTPIVMYTHTDTPLLYQWTVTAAWL